MRFLLAAVLLTSAASAASSLDRALLQSVLRRGSPAFKRCYQRALQVRPALAGKARLTLDVAADGKVSEVTVEFPMLADDFTACLREGAMKLRFPKGPAAFRVVWPVDFKPG